MEDWAWGGSVSDAGSRRSLLQTSRVTAVSSALTRRAPLPSLRSSTASLWPPRLQSIAAGSLRPPGDGVLAEFASVIEALRCAVEVQRCMAERNAGVPQDKRFEFRIGIHQGDVIIEKGDIFGDGVNVAARLEGLAQ